MKKFIKKLIAGAVSLCCMISVIPQTMFTSASDYTLYEAEDASLTGNTVKTDSDASGGECVGNFSSDSYRADFTVTVNQSGYYDITVCAKGIGSTKNNKLSANGTNYGEFFSESGVYSESTIKYVYLNSGTNTVSITKSWGWIWLDYIKVSPADVIDESTYAVSKELINPEASDSAKRLMSYLADNYGKNVLTGQQADDGYESDEVIAIENHTGELPAIIGLDLMDYSLSSVEQHNTKGDSIDRAIEVDQAGGIVAMCWHWRMYDEYLLDGTDDSGNPRWWGAFYTKNIDTSLFDLSEIMNDADCTAYKQILEDIDYAAEQLKELQEKDIPVLFRPLHEAGGGWFWWGSDGSEPYKKLWKLIYERMTEYHGLNNLIWVWNGQDADWYPGDEYCDIMGEDIYNSSYDYSPMSSDFIDAVNYSTEKKIVTLSENGVLFDIDKAIEANTLWSWFCVWGGSHASNGTSISTAYTDSDMWKEVYQHENAITLDELPDLKSYPISETTAAPTLLQKSYTLDGMIGANCDYQIPSEYLNGNYTINAVFTHDNETKTIAFDKDNTVTIDGDTAYRFTLPIEAFNMTKEYTTVLVITDSNGKEVTTSDSAVLKVSSCFRSIHSSSNEELKNLATALQTYGYYLQKQFNADASLPTSSPADVSDVTAETVAQYVQTKDKLDSDIKIPIAGTTLVVNAGTTIRIYTGDLKGYSSDDLKLRYSADGITWEESDVKYNSSMSMYYGEIPNIGASKLSNIYSAYFVNGDTQVSDKVNYGAYSYIYSILSGSYSENVNNISKALYKYSIAAENYIG